MGVFDGGMYGKGVSSAMSSGSSTSAPSGGGGGNYFKRIARQNGVKVDRVVHVDRTSDIDGKRNVVYAVEGRLDYDGPVDINGTDHVAIVGKNNAHLKIPRKNRDWDVLGGGSNHFLWANIDFDQSASGAWGRFNAPGDGIVLRDTEWIGSGRSANPNPDDPVGYKTGPGVSMPATSSGAVNIQENVVNIQRDVLANKHFGDRAIGQWYGGSHKGTLRMINCEYSGWANNALYASASPGNFEIEGGRYRDNGVSALRIPHGHIKNVLVEHDATRDILGNANTPGHASVGVASEVKKAGNNGKPGPDLINVTVRMMSVGKGGTAARAYDIHNNADWGTIKNCDFHVERGTGDWAADIEIRGDVKAIKNCKFNGSQNRHHSIDNRSGDRVVVENSSWGYPSGRSRSGGDPVDWR